MKRLQLALACAWAVTVHAVLLAAAPLEACSSGNSQCFNRNHETACTVGSATTDTCLDWIRMLEQQARSGAPEPALMMGLAHEALARLIRDPNEARTHRERAKDIYRELIRRDGSNAQATLALAVATEDRPERIRLLKQGIALAPQEIYATQLLASELRLERRPEATLEAARYMEQAYRHQSGRNKWHLASVAHEFYQLAGETELAAAFRERVRQDLGTQELKKLPADANPAKVRAALSSLCDRYALPVIEAHGCIDSMGVVVEHITAGGRSTRSQQLADGVAEAIVEAGLESDALRQARRDWQATLRKWVETLFAQGFDSAALQHAYATLTTGQQRLHALQRAAQLAPSSGQAALRLGLELASRQRWKEAKSELTRAKELLPDYQQASIDFHLQTASAKAAEQSGTKP